MTVISNKKTCYTERCIYSIQYSINVMELNIYIKKYKNRIVVYLKKKRRKKKIPENILTEVSPLGE